MMNGKADARVLEEHVTYRLELEQEAGAYNSHCINSMSNRDARAYIMEEHDNIHTTGNRVLACCHHSS